MLGLLVILIVSWGLLWLLDKSSVEKLGLLPSKQRLTGLLAGLVIAIVCCLVYFLVLAYLSKSALSINKQFGVGDFLSGFWWVSKSVLFEEFVFRGALLYLGIKYLGTKTACILSAIAFGIYHWFSYGILGDVQQMIVIFILTGTAGLLFAYCFAKTQSMYLQTGLHLGWNLVTILIFSKGPLGHQFLMATGGHQIGAVLSLVLLLYKIVALPVLTMYYVKKASADRSWNR